MWGIFFFLNFLKLGDMGMIYFLLCNCYMVFELFCEIKLYNLVLCKFVFLCFWVKMF